jgi:hypothetical protein
MFLGILGAIALAVGTIQTSNDLAEARGLPLEEANPAVVQVVEPAQDLGYPDPDMGL